MAPRAPGASSAITRAASTPSASQSCAGPAERPRPALADKTARAGHEGANQEHSMARQSSPQYMMVNFSLIRALAAALPALACACSGEVVNVGENTAELAANAACPASGIVDVRSQSELDALEGCAAIDGDLRVA